MKRLLSPLRTLKQAAKKVLRPPRYFKLSAVDIKTLLPAPPPDDSPIVLREIDAILQAQATRTPDDIKRSRHEAENLNVYLFEVIFGPNFKAQNLPRTHALFQHVDRNVNPLVDEVKKYWARTRPHRLDDRILPSVNLPQDGGYPSGHAVTSRLHALVLCQLVPELEGRLMAHGHRIGDNRFRSGIHFPGDIEAGRTLADALFPRLMASPKFQADLARAKAELATFRGKT